MRKEKFIKITMIAMVCMGLVACGKQDNNIQTVPENVIQSTQETPSEGKSVSVKELEAAVATALGDQYYPQMEVDTLEMVGITEDQYEEFIFKMPQISINNDTLLIVKAKADKVTEVTDQMNQYRDSLINDLNQYPANLSKTQCSQVVTVGNYVMFVLLGGEAGNDAVIAAGGADLKEEDAIRIEMEAIEAQNNLAIDTMKALLQ